MKILVIDAQGGGIGKRIITQLKEDLSDTFITAVGTNSIATSNMLKAGADEAATGENPIKVNAKTADIIIGPIGIVIANSLSGEITPKMAKAIGKSKAKKLLLPFNSCNNIVVGLKNQNLSETLNEIVEKVKSFSENP